MATQDFDTKKAVVSSKLREWAENYHAGYFYLRGSNPLTKQSRWTRLQRTASTEGVSVIVRKDNKKGADDLFLVGLLQDYEHDVLEETGFPLKKARVSYINREGEEDFNEDLIKENEPEDVVIFGNNDNWSPDLQFNNLQYKYLDAIYRAMIFDLEVSRPRFIIKSRSPIDKTVLKQIREQWESYNPVTYFSLGDNTPLDNVSEQWTPDSKFDKYERMWNLQFSLWRRLNNIKHNTSKKKDRHTSGEMEIMEDQYEHPENIKVQERISSLRECYEKYKGEEYTLIVDGEIIFQIGDLWGGENLDLYNIGTDQPQPAKIGDQPLENKKIEKKEIKKKPITKSKKTKEEEE